ncbi:MAG: hypothetical protein LBU57_00430 [Dysgonamonadaceae bacterium]|nr:hypothetical protein [Dysgonamonadaceae bacterium]
MRTGESLSVMSDDVVFRILSEREPDIGIIPHRNKEAISHCETAPFKSIK